MKRSLSTARSRTSRTRAFTITTRIRLGRVICSAITGYVSRDGTNGTTNLATTGRHSIPAWATRVQNRSATLTNSQYGPAISTSFPLGRYIEDHDYLGDLGKTQGVNFDLDEYNGRTC